MRLLAIDPGRTTGWALLDNNMLQDAGTIKQNRSECLNLLTTTKPLYVICEKPQIYTPTQSKGDPNDLSRLFIQAGWFDMLCLIYSVAYEDVQPHAWKGNLPKLVWHKRSKSVMLQYEIAAAKGQDHNMWDAIGIGLWKLGRRKR